MATETDKVEPADSEQDEEEDVYEVERIIDMRVEEGEVLYRVRWKNYCSDDDTWEPEAHLEDCREVLLAFKKSLAEAKAKKEAEAKKTVKLLPTKSDVFDADSESDSDKDRPTEAPMKKKKKKKIREEDDELLSKDKKKKKKEKRKEEVRPLPAPETDEEDEEEERAPTPTSPVKEKKTETKKRVVDSDEEDDEPVPSKKHKKEKGKHKKERGEDGKKKKGKRERKVDTSDEEATAPVEEYTSDGPSESQMDDTTSPETLTKSAEKARVEPKQRKGKWEVKLQGIKDLIHDKKSKKPDAAQKESSLQKLKSLTSKSKEDSAPHSDSSDSSSLHKKGKSKGQESAAAPKAPSSSASSSSSSSVTAAGSVKVEEVVVKEEVLGQKDAAGSTNLFEKFLLNCEAKDRAPRRQPPHQAPVEKPNSKPAKLIGKIEKIPKTTKDSPAQKAEAEKTDKTKQSDASKPGQSYGFTLDSDEKEGEESAAKPRVGEESSRERRERPEEAQRPSWERRTPTDDRRRRREDSEPRLFMACDDNQDNQEPPEGADKPDRGQATLSLGMDLNLDWMSLDDFQKHLNGEDEILSGPPLSPSELRDAVKSGDYMAVKLALNSKEDYNLDQEAVVTNVVLRDDEQRDDKARVVRLESHVAPRAAELAEEKYSLLAEKDAEIASLKADLEALRAENDNLRRENQRLRETRHFECQRGGLAIMEEVRAGFGELQAALREQKSHRDVSAAPVSPTPTYTATPELSASETASSPSALSLTPNSNDIEIPRQHSDVRLHDIGPEDYARIQRQSFGQVGRYGCLLFRRAISEENYKAWCKTTNWDGSRGKHELPRNVKRFVIETLKRKFPGMKMKDWKDCIDKINEFLRTPRKYLQEPNLP